MNKMNFVLALVLWLIAVGWWLAYTYRTIREQKTFSVVQMGGHLMINFLLFLVVFISHTSFETKALGSFELPRADMYCNLVDGGIILNGSAQAILFASSVAIILYHLSLRGNKSELESGG